MQISKRIFATVCGAILPATIAFAQAEPAATSTTAPVAAPVNVPAGEYVVDPAHVSLTWRIGHMGLSNYTARFTKIDATIMFDPKNVTNSTVSATIDPKSVRTDFPFPEKEDFDKVIAEKFLRAGQYPEITFKSTQLVATGPDTGQLTGNLTFLGVTKPVTLDMKLNGALPEHPMTKKAALGFSAKGSFSRAEFGHTDMQEFLGDRIDLHIEAEFNQK